VFYLSENQKGKVIVRIERFLKNAAKYRIVVKNHWNAVKADLPSDISQDDAIVIFMGARQKLFRSPAADKYPMHLANRFKRNDIFAVYSPLSLVDSDSEENLLEEIAPQEVSNYPVLEAVETQNSDFESIIGAITQKNGVLPNEIYDILFSSLEAYPVELIPGVVLIHAHTEAIKNPQIFVWFQKEMREIPPSKLSPKVLVIVLNPLSADPQIHLKTLSRIAGLFMNPKCKELIENCRNCEDLVKELQYL
jgi:mannitol/fructose-specific phosphotransferase system IIA component (Ntr-type)